MSSMRLEQGAPSGKGQVKPEMTAEPTDYPSTRYFQIHFQHLYDVIETLKEQLHEANRQIAVQNEILRTVLQATDNSADGLGHPPINPRRNGKNPSSSKTQPYKNAGNGAES